MKAKEKKICCSTKFKTKRERLGEEFDLTQRKRAFEKVFFFWESFPIKLILAYLFLLKENVKSAKPLTLCKPTMAFFSYPESIYFISGYISNMQDPIGIFFSCYKNNLTLKCFHKRYWKQGWYFFFTPNFSLFPRRTYCYTFRLPCKTSFKTFPRIRAQVFILFEMN